MSEVQGHKKGGVTIQNAGKGQVYLITWWLWFQSLYQVAHKKIHLLWFSGQTKNKLV